MRWIVVALLTFLPGAAVAQAALKDSVPHVTVVGRASTEVVPDIAVLSLAVVTEKPTAKEAAAENAQAAQALVDEIKAQGIDARDIQTSSVTLTPIYTDIVGQDERKLRGYSARNNFEVRIRVLDKAGAIARGLIDKGANEFDGISFNYEHEAEAYDKLRDAAMRDALRRAKDYLPAVGLKLGRVLEIAPNDVSAPRFALAAGSSAPAAAVPIEPGALTLETEVQVTWELTQ
ncbi:MAG: SIMPL domain-containing protein [Methylovirgula sp.]